MNHSSKSDDSLAYSWVVTEICMIALFVTVGKPGKLEATRLHVIFKIALFNFRRVGFVFVSSWGTDKAARLFCVGSSVRYKSRGWSLWYFTNFWCYQSNKSTRGDYTIAQVLDQKGLPVERQSRKWCSETNLIQIPCVLKKDQKSESWFESFAGGDRAEAAGAESQDARAVLQDGQRGGTIGESCNACSGGGCRCRQVLYLLLVINSSIYQLK